MKKLLILGLLGLPYLGACSERDRMATIDAEGLISEGSRLGVSAGMNEDAATRTLLALGMIRAGVETGGTCLSPRTFNADYTVQFLDLSWRRGTVCLGVTRGRVSHIGWLYNFMSP